MIRTLEFSYGTYRSVDLLRITLAFHDGILETAAVLEGEPLSHSFDEAKSSEIQEKLDQLYLRTWQRIYTPEGMDVLDGYTWNLSYTDSVDPYPSGIAGSNAYPWCFYKLIRILMKLVPESKRLLKPFANEVKCFY